MRRHNAMPSALVQCRMRRFASAQQGSLALFGLFIFLLMLMIGGLAVDVMRHEQRRTDLQNTLDRSVLAAASMRQPSITTNADAENVVRDYFAKAGMTQYLTKVKATVAFNSRTVSAEANASLNPFFMPLLGIQDVNVPAVGAAEEKVSNLEIVLVLDVSGSMVEEGTGQRLANLKVAANEFIDTVLGPDTSKTITISLVPFNGQVNLGPDLRKEFNATFVHNVEDVNCIDLPASAYSSLTLSRTAELPMTTHADALRPPSSTENKWSAIDGPTVINGKLGKNQCPPSKGNVVAVAQRDIAGLKAKINALEGITATSINAGMRWGLVLLDPANQSMFTSLISKGVVPATSAGRPFAWDNPETKKIIIVMTDGQHFPEDRVNTPYKSVTPNSSPIYYSSSAKAFMIQHKTGRPSAAGSKEYWYPSRGSNGAGEWRSDILSGYVQQSWKEVWEKARVSWVAWQLYARALGTSSSSRDSLYDTWWDNFRTKTDTGTMDTQLKSICTMAKSKGVLVYGITFEAPTSSKTLIKDCASSPAYYYDAQGLQISTVFRSIASNLAQLRLTQ